MTRTGGADAFVAARSVNLMCRLGVDLRLGEITFREWVEVCSCDPKSPWQRGSHENTSRLVRRYFSKGTDLSEATQHELAEALR